MSTSHTLPMRTIKDMVRDNQRLYSFVTLTAALLQTTCGFEFPVPLDDVGNATLLAQDKALLFMRYIRKHIDTIAQAKESA